MRQWSKPGAKALEGALKALSKARCEMQGALPLLLAALRCASRFLRFGLLQIKVVQYFHDFASSANWLQQGLKAKSCVCMQRLSWPVKAQL